MNYLKNKIIKFTAYTSGFIGFFLVIGSVGSSDLAVEMGVYEPWYAHMGTMLIGLVLIGIAALIASAFELDIEDDED